MRNQKGITLVALVVTIVVLLILAGTSIAMLSGDNGIITNAQKSAAANTEGEALDKMKMAYNTVSTEVIAKAATSTSYDATTETNLVALANVVSKDLGGTGTTITSTVLTETIGNYTVTLDLTNKTIAVSYADSSFGSEKTYEAIDCTMTINASKTSLTIDAKQVI